MTDRPARERWSSVAAGFLAISYGVGAPMAAVLEQRSQFLSRRLHVAPELVYATCAVQLVCAIGVLVRPLASWAAAVLTVTTLGAMALQFRMGSPLKALPAAAYSAIQIWFGLERRSRWHPPG
jgi:hypothetical protein